jgi:hypothetical protein
VKVIPRWWMILSITAYSVMKAITLSGIREGAIIGATSLGYKHMEVGVEVEAVSEGLDYCHHSGHDISIGAGLHPAQPV